MAAHRTLDPEISVRSRWPLCLIRPLILTMVLGAMYFGSRKIKKGGRLPILLICLSAMAGIAAYEL